MTVERSIRLLAGSLILVSLAITYFVSPWGSLLTGFVGLNLMQSSVTGFCPAEVVLRRLGVGAAGGSCCSVDSSARRGST